MENTSKQALRVSVVSIVVNLLLSAGKLLAGLIAHSGAMVSDAVHSASDVFSTFIVIIGLRLSMKEPDREHPYGHERMECVAAIVLAVVLLITGLLIGYAGGKQLISGRTEALPVPGALALVAYDDSGLRREAVRRVIAVAGDEVSVGEDGAVTLNGEPLDEPYAAYRDQSDWSGDDDAPGGALENPFLTPDEAAALAPPVEAEPGVDDVVFPITVPEGKLFVLCDDRDDAMDSRSSRFGLVSEQDVLGLARAIIWPAHRAGLLTGGGIE